MRQRNIRVYMHTDRGIESERKSETERQKDRQIETEAGKDR